MTVAAWEAPRAGGDGAAAAEGEAGATAAAPAGAVDETLAPFVALALRTLAPGGEEATTSLRLSLPEFRVRTHRPVCPICASVVPDAALRAQDFTKAVKGMQQRLEAMQ